MKKDWCAEEFRCMVALGESTTAGGWSTAPDRCWVPLLGALINDFQTAPMQVVNAGIGANLIARRSPAYEESGKPAADERLDKHVLSHDPRPARDLLWSQTTPGAVRHWPSFARTSLCSWGAYANAGTRSFCCSDLTS